MLNNSNIVTLNTIFIFKVIYIYNAISHNLQHSVIKILKEYKRIVQLAMQFCS